MTDTTSRTRARWAPFVMLAIVLAAAAFFWLMRQPSGLGLQPGALRRSNVLLITVDTLRADRLGAYGNAAGLTPNLDRLAHDGVRFARAFSHVPITLPAHTSILTGLLPVSHGIRNNTAFRLGDTSTLATWLKRAGYRTGAFVGAFVLDGRFGLNRDFDVYDDRYGHIGESAEFRIVERRAERVVEPALSWILGSESSTSNTNAPWLAWVHLYDPHAPYEAPLEFRPGRSPYDAEVAYTDATIGRFLDRLRQAGKLERTLIVVTSDHGESLGEHGEGTHGLFAYNATLDVPLIMTGQGLAPGVIETPVAHTEIAPTVLALLGLPVPSDLDGWSLVGPNRDRPSSHVIYFEALDANLTRGWAPLSGIIADGWKYIDLPIPELYDLTNDPAESRNAAATDPERLRTLAARLKDVASRMRSGQHSAKVTMDAETAARLAALGYVASAGVGARGHPFTNRDDPKNLVKLDEAFTDALRAQNEGRSDAALAGLRSIVQVRPDFVAAWTSAASILISAGQSERAMALLRSAPAEVTSVSVVRWRFGLALAASGKLAEAVDILESASADDANADILNSLGVVYARLGRFEDGRRALHRALDTDPTAAGTWNNLGLLEMDAGNPRGSAEAFRQAVKSDPNYGEAWRGLGAVLAREDPAGTIEAWEHAVRLQPRDYDTLFNLGMMLANTNRPADALPVLRRFIAEAPREQYARDIARVRVMIREIESRFGRSSPEPGSGMGSE